MTSLFNFSGICYQDVDEKRNCGPASALRIKASILQGVGHSLLVEVMKASQIMKTSQKWLSFTLSEVCTTV